MNRPIASLSTNRVEAFSDGVFAVAITLLVLNLQVPQLATAVLSTKLVPELLALWPKLLSYAISFIIVGIYWVGHHNTFHYIKRSDRTLLWLNLLLLLFIVFIPFPTALIGQYPEQQISVIIYASTLVCTGLVLQLLWWYASSNHRLVDQDIDPHLVQMASRRNLTAPLIYLLAIGVSFFSVQVSLIFFVLIPVYYILPGRIDWHWTGRHIHSVEEASGSSAEDASLEGEEASPLSELSHEQQ